MSKLTRDELLEIFNEEFLSTTEAYELLGISKRAFMSLVSRGKVPQINKAGVKVYLKQDIMQRLKDQEQLRPKYRPYENPEK